MKQDSRGNVGEIKKEGNFKIFTLFTTARTWWPPGCPSTDEWIKQLRYTYTVERYSAVKRSGSSQF